MIFGKEKIKSHCIGRHVFSLPDEFVPSPIATGIFMPKGLNGQQSPFEITVDNAGLTREKFSVEIKRRRSEIKKSDASGIDVLRYEKMLSDDSVLFRVQRIDDAYFSVVHILRDNAIISIRLNSYHDEYLAAEQNLLNFSSRIKKIDASDGFTHQDSFCLGNISIEGDFKNESGSFWFRNNVGEDFEVEIDTYAFDNHTPLLSRMRGPDSLLQVFDLKHKVLRSGSREVANMHAQEWLGWAELNEAPDSKAYQFTLETMRSAPGKLTPSMNVTFNTSKALDNGQPTKTRIQDDVALQLWDTVISSIRPVRP